MYKLSHSAARDFAKMYTLTLANFGQKHADFYQQATAQALENICNQPFLGQECPEFGNNMRRYHYHQQSIFYQSSADLLWIVRILHQQAAPFCYFRVLLDGAPVCL